MMKRRALADRGYSRKSRYQRVPVVERVEDRVLMAVFTVTTLVDNVNATPDDGSLRGEILASNATTTANEIDFALGSGVQTINLVAPLPDLTTTVFINGRTATGFAGVPLIQLNGTNVTTTAPALKAVASGVVIRSLIITNFKGDGIDFLGGSGEVTDSYIGIGPDGTTRAPNGGIGVFVASANNNIGNPNFNPNVISGNSRGIVVTGSNANRNSITKNYIGTDATGQIKVGNTFEGLDIESSFNTIGGATAQSRNLISGNNLGISLPNQNATNNVIQGNYIGTNITGQTAIKNTFDGIDLLNAASNKIGGFLTGEGNVISGNGFTGIVVQGSLATRNVIQGNFIGVAADKTTSLGNGDKGVLVLGANFTTVGGTLSQGNAPQYGNIIANNGTVLQDAGVLIQGAQNVAVLSNTIYNNNGLGIQLLGSNAGVAAPVLLSAQSGSGQTRITGTYFGVPNTTYQIQFFSNNTPNASGAGDGENYLNLGDLFLQTDNTGAATFTTSIPQTVAVGKFISSTATQSPFQSNNTSAFSTNVQVAQAIVADLAVTTTTSQANPLLNQNYRYTVTVTNNGPDDSTGVVLTDTIPTGSVFVSSSAGTFSNGVLTANIGSLLSGASTVITIDVKPIQITSTFTNVAFVTSDSVDTFQNNNTSTTTGTVLGNADLSIVLTPTAPTVALGSQLTYTLTVGNNGPTTSNITTVTVVFPSNFTNFVISPDQGSYSIDGSTNTLTINTGILPSNSSSTIIIQATPTTVGAAVTTATVTSTLLDPDPSNNTSSASVTVANAADLGVSISAAPDPVLLGSELVYTIIVSNNGPSQASSPVLTDILPSGLTYVPIHSSAGAGGVLTFANGTVTATLSPLAAGDSVTILIAVLPTASGQVTNTVTIADPDSATPAELDPDLTNNTASTTSQINPADLSVTILNPSDPLFIGNQAVYQILVTNNGPAFATNVLLNEVFGSGVTIVSASTGQISGGSLSANLGTLASGASTTITITILPTVSGILLSSASVTSDEFDPNPNNNTSSSSNLVSPSDLAVTLTGSPNPVLVGHQLTYTVTVTNNGPATATNVLFTDTLPQGIFLNALTFSQGLVALTPVGTIAGNLGSLAPGASATITFVVTPFAVETATNSATVSSDNFDPDSANNSVASSVGVINLPGSIQFNAPLFVVPENGGFVAVTVDRVGGTLGSVTVDYTTSDFTAIAGINYIPASGTLTFADGQSTATILIGILDDNVINGNNGFFVVLSNPTGGASLGSPAVGGVIVANTDRDTVPPTITSLLAIPNGSKLNGFVLTFSEPMDPIRASLVSNYHVFLSGSNGSSQGAVPLAAAIYNEANHSVTLVPTAPLPANRFYEIQANGSFGPALTDTSGNVLTGSFGPASNYQVYYGQGTTLVYNDSQNNLVTIKLTGGGTLAIFRAANGDASEIDLYGIVPKRTKISGTVKKLNKKGSGHTNIGLINGFGQFGNVKSSLTTPSFYVASAPVTASSVKVPVAGTASASSVKTSTVSVKSKTPRGPRSLVH